MTAKEISSPKFLFSSSTAADVAHPQINEQSFEWWYFDALSDDGSEAVVVIFLDNFIFSPRYNNKFRKRRSQTAKKNVSTRIPAVAFIYYKDGKPVYRAINEFEAQDFSASIETPACSIGESSFSTETAAYGSGYLLNLKINLSRQRRLEATFEWLSIESDLTPEKCDMSDNSHCWNLVAPRSDVTGKINIFNKNGKETDTRQFRGTGYHDHNLDNRWLPETVRDWHWGRVHFADVTAVFYHYREISAPQAVTKLLIVRDGVLQEFEAECVQSNYARDKFGIKYPTRLKFESRAENISLTVHNRQIMDSSFFYLRFLSEMTLTGGDQVAHTASGIAEYLAPEALKYRWLNWLVNMRIGRHGKGAFLP